jgi:hypothetical protein
LSTPGRITIKGGVILANGGHAEPGYGNGLSDSMGPGGGGSGGNVEVRAGILELLDATIEARGGYGGAYFAEPYALNPFLYTTGATGGRGYLDVVANWVTVTPGTRIDAVHNVARPTFRDVSLRAANLVVSVSGGRPHGLLQVLSSPTVATNLASWIPWSTNYFDANGNCVFTNAPAAGEAQRFFILRSR